jgi:hypothetical protein
MDTLTNLEKATIDGEDNLALADGAYTVTSSDPAVASVAPQGGYWYCVGEAAGLVTLSAIRLSDSVEGFLDVTVTEDTPGTFAIHLGAHSPK